MSTNLSPVGGAAAQFLDNNGNPLTGGKLFTYAAGTTTPQATFTTFVGNVAHSNPIILDAAGRVPSGEIWLTATLDYKFTLTTSADVPIATWDNILGINGTGLATNANAVAYDPAGLGAVQRTVESKLRESVSVKDFGAVGNGFANDTDAIQAAINTGKAVYIPNGTYLVSALTLGAGTIMRGETKERTILKGTAANSVIFVTGFKKHINLSNFTIDANNIATNCFETVQTFYSVIENLYLINATNAGVLIKQDNYFNTFRDLTMEYCATGLVIDPPYNPAVVNGVVNENLFQRIECRFFSVRGVFISAAIGNTFQNFDIEVSTDTAVDCMRIDHASNNKFIAVWFEPATATAAMTRLVHLDDSSNPFWTQNNSFDTCYFVSANGPSGYVDTGVDIENGYFNKITNSLFQGFAVEAIKISATSVDNTIEGCQFLPQARPAITGTSQGQIVTRTFGSFQFVAGTDTVDINVRPVSSAFYYNSYRIDAIVTGFGSITADQLNIYSFKNISPNVFRLYHSGANLTGSSTITVEYTVTYLINP
jgi:hypothetical protein